jgi:hypothetical protein
VLGGINSNWIMSSSFVAGYSEGSEVLVKLRGQKLIGNIGKLMRQVIIIGLFGVGQFSSGVCYQNKTSTGC